MLRLRRSMAYRMRMSFRLVSLAAVCAALVLSGCSGTAEVPPGLQRPEHGHTSQATLTPKPVPTTPARKGESFTTVTMPAAYAPKAPTKSGTDEYRCFLIDPCTTSSSSKRGPASLPRPGSWTPPSLVMAGPALAVLVWTAAGAAIWMTQAG